jgi:hypothetical protein
MARPNRPFIPKSKFSYDEDQLLSEAVSTHGSSNWNTIAALLPGRTARQCRERWTNYVSPNLTTEAWTDADDRLLLEKYQVFGSQWHLIARFFKGRSKNSIFNRFLALQRKSGRECASESGTDSPPIDPMSAISEQIAKIMQSRCADPTTQDGFGILDEIDPIGFLDEGNPIGSKCDQEGEPDLSCH